MKQTVIVLLMSLIVGYSVALFADNDEHGEKKQGDRKEGATKTGLTVTDATYLKECGACHFAYQPDLLPSQSWINMMNGLDKHFGENAELSEETRKTVLAYLSSHAAEHSTSWYAAKFMKSLKSGVVPARISEVPYFVKEHREVPKKLIAENPEVKSISFCNSCHTDADTGGYREGKINIPNHGAWRD
jgi:mono/diheme cytochrome c family protein